MLNVNICFITHYSPVCPLGFMPADVMAHFHQRREPRPPRKLTEDQDVPLALRMLSLKAPVTDSFGFVLSFSFLTAKINSLEFFSSPFVKEQSLLIYVNVSLMKGCQQIGINLQAEHQCPGVLSSKRK